MCRGSGCGRLCASQGMFVVVFVYLRGSGCGRLGVCATVCVCVCVCVFVRAIVAVVESVCAAECMRQRLNVCERQQL